MLSKRVVLVVVALCCLFALTPSALYSQSASAGSVAGLVTDASGGSVVGATITMTDRATHTPRTTSSNEAGRYNFANVSPGMYEISSNKTGFRVAKVNEVQVTVGTTLTIDFKMEVGSVSEIIEVTSTGAELQTTNATMGTTLSGETLLLLPNLGRDVTTLLIAQPGVSPDGYSAGANYDQNMYQLDGGNNSNDMDGSMSIYTPSSGSTSPQNTGGAPSGVMPTPVESVEEFKVSTSNQTADFNGAGGAQVQLVTRRGTDTWHGAVYEYYLGSNFGANTWDNDFSGLPKVSTHQNRYGGAVGGKILPKLLGGNTYFFANYEGFREIQKFPAFSSLPSLDDRRGVFTVPVRNPHVMAAVIRIGTTLDAIDHAAVRRQNRLAPHLAQIDATVARSAFDRPVAGALGAEHTRVTDRHATHRPAQRMDPGIGGDFGRPIAIGRGRVGGWRWRGNGR